MEVIILEKRKSGVKGILKFLVWFKGEKTRQKVNNFGLSVLIKFVLIKRKKCTLTNKTNAGQLRAGGVPPSPINAYP